MSGDPLPLKDVRVLVVDNDGPSARLLSVLLTQAGCIVRVAYSAEEALAALPFFPAKAVILELRLPRMSGLLLAEHVKDLPTGRDIVVIAVSAVNGAKVRQLALDAGCATLIAKPIDVIEFVGILIRHLKGEA